MENLEEVVYVENDWTISRTVWTQWTGTAASGARPTDVEETNSCSGWPQRAISLRDIMNHESDLGTISSACLVPVFGC